MEDEDTMFLRHMSPQTYAQIPKYSCLLGLKDLSRTFKVSKGPSLENLKTKSKLRAWTFCAYPSHPHSSHHRNFDPGICEVVGRAKYGSFLSSGNFRGIFPLQSIQHPTPRFSSIPNIFTKSSSVSDPSPQSSSSPDY